MLAASVPCEALAVGPGPVAVWLTFDGGRQPTFTRVEIRGLVRDGDASPGIAKFSAPPALGPMLDRLIDALADLTVDAEVHALDDVSIALASGLEILLHGGETVRVSGASEGPSRERTLSRPLEASFGGRGLRVSHRNLRWLASRVPVSVTHARLHPDGRVELYAAGGRLARLLQGGLTLAGEQLTEIVRTSPVFERVRAFLRAG